MQVHVVTRSARYGGDVIGVFTDVEAAKAAALDDAHRQLARGCGNGAETLEWRKNDHGLFAVGSRDSYVIDTQPVRSEAPAVRGVREHEIAYFTSLVREDLVDIDAFSDADQAAIREALAAA